MLADHAEPYGTLRIHQAGRPDRDIALTRPATTVGRAADCDIVLDFPAVSRRHLALRWVAAQGFDAIDLNSTHGTEVDGRRIVTPARLRPGSRIWLGDALGNGVTLTFLTSHEEGA